MAGGNYIDKNKSSCLNIKGVERCRKQEIADYTTLSRHNVSATTFNF